jgi:hypothetical protein
VQWGGLWQVAGRGGKAPFRFAFRTEDRLYKLVQTSVTQASIPHGTNYVTNKYRFSVSLFN